MKTLFVTFVALILCGCANKNRVPDVRLTVIHNTPSTLEGICRQMEAYTVEVGTSRLSRREKKRRKELETNLEQTPMHEMVRQEMSNIMATVYALPIEDYEDVEAIANLVYENCVATNQLLL